MCEVEITECMCEVEITVCISLFHSGMIIGVVSEEEVTVCFIFA